jgi:hypothetical protein
MLSKKAYLRPLGTHHHPRRGPAGRAAHGRAEPAWVGAQGIRGNGASWRFTSNPRPGIRHDRRRRQYRVLRAQGGVIRFHKA